MTSFSNSNNFYSTFFEWFSKFDSKGGGIEELLNGYIDILNDFGLRIERANFGTATLHPEIETVSYAWNSHQKKEITAFSLEDHVSSERFETKSGTLFRRNFRFGTFRNKAFLNSPVAKIISDGLMIRSRLDRELTDEDFPIYHDLKQLGFTEYIAIPYTQGKGIRVFLSFATTHPNGLSESELEFLTHTSQVIAMRWERSIQQEIMENLLKTYLGKKTGPRVISGKIRRGDLEKIDAIIWISDIRGFTKLAQLLSPEDLVLYLNQYFELVLPIIERTGGEVLKLMGDAVLAVYPFSSNNKRNVHFRALVAARQVDEALEKINETHWDEGKPLMLHGIGLHYGTVLYGNIGSADRLDFTVIGTAVNETSRIAGLCANLGKTVLASEEFAKEVPVPWVDMGLQQLKGFESKRNIFGL